MFVGIAIFSRFPTFRLWLVEGIPFGIGRGHIRDIMSVMGASPGVREAAGHVWFGNGRSRSARRQIHHTIQRGKRPIPSTRWIFCPLKGPSPG